MKKFLLPSVLIILILTYALSFFVNQGKEKFSKTSLLNPAFRNEVTALKIIKPQNGTELYFTKNRNYWKCSNTTLQGQADFPCLSETIEKELDNLKNIISMSEISYTRADDSDFGLDEQNKTVVEYVLSDGKSTVIEIGKKDFSRLYRYIRINGKKQIYKAKADLDYISLTESQMWYDPFIIPRNLFEGDYKNIQKIRCRTNGKTILRIPSSENDFSKLLELRHGALSLKKDNSNPVLNLEIETGNQEIFYLNFFPEDNDYLLRYEFRDLKTQFHISSWTFSSILKELNLN